MVCLPSMVVRAALYGLGLAVFAQDERWSAEPVRYQDREPLGVEPEREADVTADLGPLRGGVALKC